VEDVGASGDELYGLFYTGGTTAASKGVMLSHANIVTNAYNTNTALGIDASDIYLHGAPMFHMADSASTFALTMNGAQHAFIPAFDVAKTLEAIQAFRVTLTLLVPTMINAVVHSPQIGGFDLSSLKRIVYGASPMPAALLEKALDSLRCQFLQGYGMTETAPLLTYLPARDHVIGGDEKQQKRLRAAGLPVLNIDLRILDPEGRQLPAGEIGEICVKGANVMKGYWRKPEATAEALRGGFMHTGDLGYLDEDGYVYLVDRAKDMIVSGGENIYCVEVEAALYLHPAVLEAAVFGIPHDEWGEQVHAVVVLKEGQTSDPDQLIEHCKSRIASYKCPKTLTLRREALPKSGAGKILKRELRAPFWQGQERQIH
jgi:long-chain acyl-CoA synthetase